MTGSLGGVGAKYLELQRWTCSLLRQTSCETVDKDGTSVVKLYALDPSKVASYNPSTDVNTLDLTNYTLLYTSDPVKPGGKPTPSGTKDALTDLGYVDSKGWTIPSSCTNIYGWWKWKCAFEWVGTIRLLGMPLQPHHSSQQMSILFEIILPTSLGEHTRDKASGYPSFFNNYSLPSIKEISTDVTHYYRKSDVTGNVYVHYKDTEGNELKTSVTDEAAQLN